MTVSLAEEQKVSSDSWPIRMSHEQFGHHRFTEESDWQKSLIARKVHAADYLTKGFVLPSAINSETGLFEPGIDLAVGENVTYYLALKDKSKSTLRMIHVPEGGNIYELPALHKCDKTLSAEGRERVAELCDTKKHIVKEFGALASTGLYGPVGIFEQFDRIVDESISEENESGKEVTWMFSIVSSTLESLRYKMGNSAFNILGDGTSIDDDRVQPHIRVVPTKLSPSKFRINLIKDMIAEKDLKRKKSLAATVIHFTKAIDFKDSVLSSGRKQALNLIGKQVA